MTQVPLIKQLLKVCALSVFGFLPFLSVAQDVTAPELNSYSASAGATEVRLPTTYFSVTFNENVKYVSGGWRLIESNTGDVVKTTTPSTNSSYRSWQYVYFPNGLLKPGTEYHIEIDAGAYEDEAGNKFAGISDASEWSFTTEVVETDLPLIGTLNPLDNSVDISISRTFFSIYFNEQVKAVSGSWRLKKADTDEVVKTLTLTPSNYYDNNQSINFGNGLLEASTEYYIEVDAGAYQDVFGNAFAGITESSTWSFTTQAAESDAPVISSLSPSHGSNDISIAQRSFSITFDEVVTYVSGSWRLVKSDNGEIVKTATPNASSSYNSWWNIYFPTGLLEPSTTYHIEIDEGSYTDVFNNDFAGISANNIWSFTTQEADVDNPEVTSFSPTSGSVGVKLTQTQFSLSFDEQVKSAAGNWRLIKTATGETVKTVTLNSTEYFSSGQSVNFSGALLEASTQYHIQVDAGAYEDLFGNKFQGVSDNSWSFTTQDPETTAPTVESLSPTHEATDIKIGLTLFEIRFDEEVIHTGGKWKLVKTSTGEVIKTATPYINDYRTNHNVYFPNELLEPSTQYHIEIAAGTYEDAFKNDFGGFADESSWSFTTQAAESDPPQITTYNPSNSSINVNIDRTHFSLNFNEVVASSNGEWRLVESGTGEIVKRQSTSASTNYGDWQSVSFPSGFLKPSTKYHIEIDAGSYKDAFANDFAGISDQTTWSFTTVDPETNPPVASNLNPQHNSTNVSLAQRNFSISFDERVLYQSGDWHLVKTSTDEIVKTVTPYSQTNYSSWQNVTFSEGLLEPGTQYHLIVDQGTYVDVFGNKFAGITDKTTWSFTTQEEETVAPKVTSFNPTKGSIGIDIQRNYFSVSFDEPVKYTSGKWRLIKTSTGKVVKTATPWNNSSFNTNPGVNFSNELLEPSTEYRLEIDEGAYVDIFGNSFQGIKATDGWSFTTQDPETDPPTLTTLTPDHNTLDYSLTDLSFTMQFNEVVKYSKGVIYLVETATDEIVKSTIPIDYGGYSNDRSFSFTQSLLKPNVQYHIQIDAGMYEDLFGNKFAGISDGTVWSFTTRSAETDAPKIEELFPSHGSNGISINHTYFRINFDEAVKYEGGALRLVNTTTSEVVKYATPNSGGTYDDQVVFYFPSGLLDPNTQYHLKADAGMFVDEFGNDNLAIDDQIWSFTTQETESDPPLVTSFGPNDNSQNVSLGYSYFYIDFNEVVKTNAGQARLIKTSTGELIQVATPVSNGQYSSRRNFNFGNLGLESFTDYHIEVDDGTFEDVFGNKFQGINTATRWNFKTADTNPPVFTSGGIAFVDENTTDTKYVITATDEDRFRFTLSDVGDSKLFNIDLQTSKLLFVNAPDHESPADQNKDNGYEVEIYASDNSGNVATHKVVVVVADKDENKPQVTSALQISFEENKQTIAYLPTVIDESKVTYSLSAGLDTDLFSIDTGTGGVSFKSSPDFENPTDSNKDSLYEFGLKVVDESSNVIEVTVKVQVTDVDEVAPVFSSATKADFNENGTGLVYQAVATDIGSVTYQLSATEDHQLFALTASGGLHFVNTPNFEKPADLNKDNVYSVKIEAHDPQKNIGYLELKISVLNVVEAPKFSSGATASFVENGTDVAYKAIATGDSEMTYQITSKGTDGPLFSMDKNTGEVKFLQAPNFESPADADATNTYLINVQATDVDGNVVALDVQIQVTDLDENSPKFISANTSSIVENSTSVAYQANASDESSLTYSLSGTGADNALFKIDGSTGNVSFLSAPDFESPVDHDKNNVYEITILAKDQLGNQATQQVSISVLDHDENSPLFISPQTTEYTENQTGIAYQAVASYNGSITYQIDGSASDNSLFSINGTTGEVSFLTSPDFEDPKDHDKDNVYEVMISATVTTGNSSNQLVKITVMDFDEASPVFISAKEIYFVENKVVVAYQAIATDASVVQYKLSGDKEDNGLFDIIESTGEISFKNSPDYEAPADHDSNNTYQIGIQATDALGYSATWEVSIHVAGENDNAPTADRVSVTGVYEVDQVITATYEFNDPDQDEENNSSYRWYRSAAGSLEDMELISEASDLEYTISGSDAGFFLAFEVIPNDGLYQGGASRSEFIYINQRILSVDPLGQEEVKVIDEGGGVVSVQFPEVSSKTLHVYSLAGSRLQSKNTEKASLTLNNLKSGIWILRWQDEENIGSVKFKVGQ